MLAMTIRELVRAGPLPMPSARPIPAPFARKIGIVTRELGLFRLSLVVVHPPAFHFLAARRRLACFLFGDDSRNCFNPCRISVRLPLRLPSAMCFSSHWMASPPPDDSDFRISWRIMLSFFVPIIRASPIGPTVLGCGELLPPRFDHVQAIRRSPSHTASPGPSLHDTRWHRQAMPILLH